MEGTTVDGAAVACTLGTDDLATQAERWRALLERAAVARNDTELGRRIQFRADAGVEEELRALVAVETRCCSWAEWNVDRSGSEVVLDVHSTGEGVVALQGMFTST
ncbi:MAG TPA: hypothetical protein VNY33_04455 [Gaiellaceae bacterium]|jgi:hypothetical protein|nr:hypothetical protein [Gaiellaceae bacterium]